MFLPPCTKDLRQAPQQLNKPWMVSKTQETIRKALNGQPKEMKDKVDINSLEARGNKSYKIEQGVDGIRSSRQLHPSEQAATKKRTRMYLSIEEQEQNINTQLGQPSAIQEAKVSDKRHPLFLGDWKRSIPNKDEGFAQDDLDEPHVKRRITILQKHPEIEDLYGYDSKTQYITIFCVSLQVLFAYMIGKVFVQSNVLLIVAAYFVGASITSMLGVVLHECTHALVAKDLLVNKIYGLIANIALPFPIAMSFRRYHLDHHAYQGVPGKDPDLPLSFELTLIKGNSFLKFIWLFFFPMLYILRGAAFGRDISKWERINIATTVLTDIILINLCGWRGFFYMVASLWLGYGIHPAAAHFIQEHYTFTDGQETYSYYGSLNRIFMNIGYHNEHHDFTKVPWSKLPDIKKIAPEFYNPLKAHYSWCKVLFDFVMSPLIGPQSRASRDIDSHKTGRRMIKIATDGVKEKE